MTIQSDTTYTQYGRTAQEVADQELEEFNLMYTYSQPPHSSSESLIQVARI